MNVVSSVLARFRPPPERGTAFRAPLVWAETSAEWSRQRRIDRLALIWPYSSVGGVVGGVVPLDDGQRLAVLNGDYLVRAAVAGRSPYTHVVSSGRQDYLASFVVRPDPPDSPPPSAPPRQPDQTDRRDAEARSDRAALEEWGSEGGAPAGGHSTSIRAPAVRTG